MRADWLRRCLATTLLSVATCSPGKGARARDVSMQNTSRLLPAPVACALALGTRNITGASEIDPRKLLHVPKTGGSSLTHALQSQLGILASSALVKASGRGVGINGTFFRVAYAQMMHTDARSGLICPPWHTPPRKRVSGSYAILRAPMDRLVSSFDYWVSQFNPSRSTERRCSCSKLENWAKKQLRIEMKRGGALGCHMVPQLAFARKADFLIPYEAWAHVPAWFGLNGSRVQQYKAKNKCVAFRTLLLACTRTRNLVTAMYPGDIALHERVLRLSCARGAPRPVKWTEVLDFMDDTASVSVPVKESSHGSSHATLAIINVPADPWGPMRESRWQLFGDPGIGDHRPNRRQ